MTYVRRALALALMVAAMSSVSLAVDPGDAPEFDPASIGSAVTLMSAGMLLISGRRAK